MGLAAERRPAITGFEDWPDNLYVVKADSLFGCFSTGGILGLACFDTADKASSFGRRLAKDGAALRYTVLGATFDTCRDIAKGRPGPLMCLFLFGAASAPLIHWIN